MSEMLPEHWKTVRLEEIADVRGGASFPKAYQGNTEGKYPFYKVSDMNLRGNETLMQASNNWVEKDVVKTLRAKLFSKDTVIFPKVGAAVHTNKKRLLSCDGLVDNNVMGVTIRDYDLCIPYYLLYWFVFVDLVDFSNPGPLPSITATRVKNAKIPLPPLPEQRAIAHVLQTIQEAKSARQRELALERERKAALMDYLFSHGTKGEPRKQTEIGEIPESWEVVRLEKLCACLDSKRIPVKQSERNERKGNVPYYGASGQAGWIDDYLFNEPLLLVAEDGENLVSRKLPIAYSIEGKSWVNNHAHVLRITDINQFFLEYYFNSIDLSPYLSGTTRPKLNKASLLGIPISRPSRVETDEIALVLSSCDTKIAALEQEAERLDELFHAMLDELMTGKRSAVPLIDAELPN